MESTTRIENMARELVTAMMIRAYEKEIRNTARIEHMVKQTDPRSAPWYCPMLVELGNMLISIGLRLKVNYSASAALRTR